MNPHNLPAWLAPFPITGVSDEQLGDVLDAWLADQFASDDHRHIHSWHEEDMQNR